MASSSSSNPAPCAACKFLRRKCLPGCTFAPYFPAEQPTKFVHVHKIFGASNVGKLLNEIPPHQREDAVNSLAYEAEARLNDPVYGCVGAISVLQRQVFNLQKELDATNADIIRYAASRTNSNNDWRIDPDGSGYFDPNSGLFLPYYWSGGGGAAPPSRRDR
ncbi:hypothetical protein ABFS82_08G008500 [Erythranthe guttata]|uniref:protein LATERAL ORGAN BOUNDARIES n=1 Tax=Erythranthe guttata TaxID=4155 RepID=UPI00064D997A|nr:PREDICTED: protein LATERAL ORGAN BOUNDARIES [Erythranthe guttata]|eukprot:XP_012850821.1 PREDICTED: protein LATERAL ORGAN BOUNDARIES [Erythranthe guttata]